MFWKGFTDLVSLIVADWLDMAGHALYIGASQESWNQVWKSYLTFNFSMAYWHKLIPCLLLFSSPSEFHCVCLISQKQNDLLTFHFSMNIWLSKIALREWTGSKVRLWFAIKLSRNQFHLLWIIQGLMEWEMAKKTGHGLWDGLRGVCMCVCACGPCGSGVGGLPLKMKAGPCGWGATVISPVLLVWHSNKVSVLVIWWWQWYLRSECFYTYCLFSNELK